LASPPAEAQHQPATLSPESPRDGASVGKKPRFVVRASGTDVEQLRFRIELSTDDFRTIAYTFDQLKDPNGWAYTLLDDESPGAVYFLRQPIEGGDYLWRVGSWDGLSWRESATPFHLRIDDVPPADVDGVLMWREPATGCVRITWSAVTTDRDGRPERVALYHVYRYASKGPTQPIRPFEAGETASLELDDCDAEAAKKPILFYRVVAEDEAGNIPGRRY
jgi:hypothetical protein